MHALILGFRWIRCKFPCVGTSFSLHRHCGFHWNFQLFPWVLNGFFELIIRINKSRRLSIFAHCRASASRQPTAAFPFVELLLTYWTRFLTGDDQALWLLECLQAASSDHVYPPGGLSLKIVNCVKPVHRSDKFRSASVIQKSSIRLSCNTPRDVCVVLTTSMYRCGIGNVASFGTKS